MCVIVKEKAFSRIYDELKRFHSSMSNDEFITLQKLNRKLWNDYFTKEGFFKTMKTNIQKLIKN